MPISLLVETDCALTAALADDGPGPDSSGDKGEVEDEVVVFPRRIISINCANDLPELSIFFAEDSWFRTIGRGAYRHRSGNGWNIATHARSTK